MNRVRIEEQHREWHFSGKCYYTHWANPFSFPWNSQLNENMSWILILFFPLEKFNWGTICGFIVKGSFDSKFQYSYTSMLTDTPKKDIQTARQADSLTYWLTGSLVDGRSRRWGDEEHGTGWVGGWAGGLGKVSEVKASRVHPSSPIGQTAQQSCAALKPWSGQNSTMAMGIVACHL